MNGLRSLWERFFQHANKQKTKTSVVLSQGLFQQPVQNNNDGFYFINTTIEDQKRQKTYYKDLSKASLAISVANQENMSEGISHMSKFPILHLKMFNRNFQKE
jgi:hypothetical protein